MHILKSHRHSNDIWKRSNYFSIFKVNTYMYDFNIDNVQNYLYICTCLGFHSWLQKCHWLWISETLSKSNQFKQINEKKLKGFLFGQISEIFLIIVKLWKPSHVCILFPWIRRNQSISFHKNWEIRSAETAEMYHKAYE